MLLSSIVRSKEIISIGSTFNEEEIQEIYKLFCKNNAIFEVYSFEKKSLKEHFFNVEKTNNEYIITLSNDGCEFFSEIQKVVAFVRAKEDYVYTDLPIDSITNAALSYNTICTNKFNIEFLTNNHGKPNIEYINNFLTQLQDKAKKVIDSNTAVQITFIKKLVLFLDKHEKKSKRLGDLPLNYTDGVFQEDRYKFLEFAFNTHLKGMQESKFISHVVPIIPSGLSLFTAETSTKIEDVKELLLKTLQDTGIKVSTAFDIKKFNWLLSNKSLGTLAFTLIVAGYLNKDLFDLGTNEEEILTFRSVGSSVKNKSQLDSKTANQLIKEHLLNIATNLKEAEYDYINEFTEISVENFEDFEKQVSQLYHHHFDDITKKYPIKTELVLKNGGNRYVGIINVFTTLGNKEESMGRIVRSHYKKIPN